jgi:hypothetical protein
LRNEGRYDFSRHADRPAQRFVDNRPLSLRPNADFPVRAGEFHQPVESSALRRLANPGPRRDSVALHRGAEVVDLVPQLYNARRYNVPLDNYPTLLRADENANKLDAFAAAHPDKQGVPE